MTRRKALFVDLDGTLFDKHNGIPKSTIDALNHLLPDVDLYLATGRSSYTLAVIEEIIPLFKGLLLLNGQHVMVNHKTIFYNTMKKEHLLKLHETAVKYQLRSVMLLLTKHMFILIPKISINFFRNDPTTGLSIAKKKASILRLPFRWFGCLRTRLWLTPWNANFLNCRF